jgi:deoxyribose-phosphate aldolase
MTVTNMSRSLPAGSVAVMTALVARSDPPDWVNAFAAGAVRIPAVDAVGLEARAAALTGRSIKKASKVSALRLAIECMDLTTLEGIDTPGKVRALCAKAMHPDPLDAMIPSVAAVCVYPELVAVAKHALHGSGVKVASVAGAFPAGLGPLPTRLDEIRRAVDAGADEIDIVLNRSAFLAGDLAQTFDDVAASKVACGPAHLKVILETGELGTYDNVRRASMLAMAAGGDFIKTSTGKVAPAATLPVTLLMLEVVRDWHRLTGEKIGVKPAGGIRQSKDAIRYLVTVAETVGEEWLQPHLFRFGASSLLNDVLLQRQKLSTGHYSGPDYVTID